jgi:hypothetical protein
MEKGTVIPVSSALIGMKEAKMAVDLALPSIRRAMRIRLFKRSDLHIVVLKPGIPYDPNLDFEKNVILYERSLGSKENWKYPYQEYARSKARLSWRTGLPSLDVVLRYPHLLQKGDVKYGGSVILKGTIVAASGVQSHFDESSSHCVAAVLNGIAIEKMQRILAEDRDFLV